MKITIQKLRKIIREELGSYDDIKDDITNINFPTLSYKEAVDRAHDIIEKSGIDNIPEEGFYLVTKAKFVNMIVINRQVKPASSKHDDSDVCAKCYGVLVTLDEDGDIIVSDQTEDLGIITPSELWLEDDGYEWTLGEEHNSMYKKPNYSYVTQGMRKYLFAEEFEDGLQ